jgi:ubiquinone/menaquinone biosynthesis C-methylase UbiE
MPDKVTLYDIAYEDFASNLYRQIRCDTYGDDLGQTSWATQYESNEIPRHLRLTPESHVLEIGCGSGGYAVYLAERTGCNLVGIDLNAQAIRNANRLARAKEMDGQLTFQRADASKKLPFPEDSFDAVFATDVFCHIPSRLVLLAEVFRVLKHGGRLLFSDALIVAGSITQREIALRCTPGLYVFSVPGENERLITATGFSKPKTKDTTTETARIATQWRDARKKRKQALILQEGEVIYKAGQKFLACAAQLAGERRLLRQVFLAQKP